jgi:hypothetical protein
LRRNPDIGWGSKQVPAAPIIRVSWVIGIYVAPSAVYPSYNTANMAALPDLAEI